MAALISYPTVNNFWRKSDREIEEKDLLGADAFGFEVTNEYLVVPFIVMFEDNVYSTFGSGIGIEAKVKIQLKGEEPKFLLLTSEEAAEELISSLKIELEDFYGNYKDYVKTIG